jgi:hypothetical protein
MNAVDLISLVMATGALADAWRNGSLFDKIRPTGYDPDSPWFRRLLSCDFCLGYHLPFLLGLITWAAAQTAPGFWGRLLALPLYTLAATRAAWLVNGFLPDDMRYQPVDGVRLGAPVAHIKSEDLDPPSTEPLNGPVNEWDKLRELLRKDSNPATWIVPPNVADTALTVGQGTVSHGKAPKPPEKRVV